MAIAGRPTPTYADALAAAGRPAASAPPAGKRVLMVGVEVRQAFRLAAALEDGGLEVAFAEDEREASERSGAAGADLVLIDASAGEATISAIRAIPALADVPVLAPASQDADRDAARCLVPGAKGYLQRPVDVDGLLPLIRTWLGR